MSKPQTLPFFEIAESDPESFESALARFVANVNEFRRAHYAERYPNLVGTMEVASVDPRGKKYLRIVLKRPGATQGSVYCFVDVATGAVLKAEGFKKPHPLPRGTIFSSDWAGYGCTVNGAAYVR